VVAVWALRIVVSAWLRDDSFYGKNFYVSYITFLINFENQTQVYNLG